MLTIDPNNDVIQLGIPQFCKDAKTAEERKNLYHFCNLESAKKILNTKSLKMKCLTSYTGISEYEKRGLDDSLVGRIFIASFTCIEDSQVLWDSFGDEQKGVRIGFNSKDAFHTVAFDKTKKVHAYNSNGQCIDSFGFNTSVCSNPQISPRPNFDTDIFVDLYLVDVVYSRNSSIVEVSLDNGPALILTSVSRQVEMTFLEECETRLIGILRSWSKQEIPEISYLLAPLSPQTPNFEITAHCGEKVSQDNRQAIRQLLNDTKPR